MNTAKYSIVAIALALAAILVAASGVYIGYKAEKGDAGDIGTQGVAGDVGLEGPQGQPGINGTDGTNGSQGPQGYTGCTGAIGSKGDQGDQGDPGIDLEPNDAPVISVNDSKSHVEGCWKYDDFWFHLNITTTDTENDYRKISLYYRWDVNNSWSQEKSWPYITNGDYNADWEEKSGNCFWGNRTLYWLVEVMDGENLVYLPGSTTLEKLVCPP